AVAVGVRAVAVSLADEGASAQVEMALRRAFREQTERRNAPAARLLPAWQQWRRLAVGAAIAAIILFALLTAMRSLKPSATNERQETSYRPSMPASPAPRRETPAPNGGADIRKQEPARESAGARHAKRHRNLNQPAATETVVATSFYPLVEEGE